MAIFEGLPGFEYKKQPGDTPAEGAFNLYAMWGRVRITLR